MNSTERKEWAKEEVFDALSEWLNTYFENHPDLSFDDREALSKQVARAKKAVTLV